MGKKFLFTGGGTLGSVIPLLSVAEVLHGQNNSFDYLWIGTRHGPEKDILATYHDYITFISLPEVKLRRYFSLRIFIDPFVFLFAILRASWILLSSKPDVIVSAGSFVSVPVVIAGWFLRVPSLIHQQDIVPGLANRIMALFARTVTVVFAEQAKHFSKRKVVVTGNPVRSEVAHYSQSLHGEKISRKRPFRHHIDQLDLLPDIPVVVVTGGGSGADQINQLVWDTIRDLVTFCQVVHVTGKEKNKGAEEQKNRLPQERYHAYEFLTDKMPATLAAADVVVSRAGFSTLTELAVLGKPAVIIPMPHSHQVKNAEFFAAKKAITVLFFDYHIGDEERALFVRVVRGLVSDAVVRQRMSERISKLMPCHAAEKVGEEVLGLLG